jgi:hypothetical protein
MLKLDLECVVDNKDELVAGIPDQPHTYTHAHTHTHTHTHTNTRTHTHVNTHTKAALL